jgi:hypothetical protein
LNRWLALFLSVAGGLAVSFVLTFAIFVGLGSMLWIFVFGDDTWPEWVRSSIDASILPVGIATAAWAAWIIWTRLTARPEAG